MEIFNEMESEVRGYCRDYPAIFSSSRGSEIFTANGDRYIDFLGGAGTLNYGHNHPILKKSVIEYLERDGVLHGLDFHTEAKQHFLATLRDVIFKPRGMDHKVQFTGPTGTNAVEAAMKLARKVTGRSSIVSFTNGYHGMSLGALAATGNMHHRGGSGTNLGGTTFMPFAGYFGSEADTIAYIERLLDDPSSGVEIPAAMIIETVQGEGGVNVASAEWMRRLEAACKSRDILLIVDDIQAGNGRTGTFFSFEGMGIEPDIVTISKSIGGVGLPMALVLMKPELDQWNPGEHNGTFRGNNLAFVAATKAIETFWQDNTFSKEIMEKSSIIRQHLQWIKADNQELDIRIRGRGMMWGIDIPAPGLAAAVVEEAFKRKLIIENCGSGGCVVKFLGPLTTPTDILEEGLRLLAECVKAVAQRVETGDLQEAGK